MDIKIREEIYFPNINIFAKISEILLKNDIDETPVEAMFKERSFISIALNLTKNIAGEKISEKDFCLSLQTELKISEKTAKNILKEIKVKILPLAEKVIITKQEEESILTKPVRLIDETKIVPEKPIKEKPETKTADELTPTKEEVAKKFPEEPDKYRESIE